MFGLDLTKYIEENITFNHNGRRPNQDIYYSIKDDKFWTHVYFGNETLDLNWNKRNILICHISNTDEFDMVCDGCDGCDDKREYDCPCWQECQAESLHDYIQEHEYDDLWGSNGLYYQIKDHIDNCHISELAEVKQLLEYHYGDYHKWIQEQYNSIYEVNVYDDIIDNIVYNGFGDGIDDGWLDGYCQALIMKYEYIDDKKLKAVLKLLEDCKILEALKLLKGDN